MRTRHFDCLGFAGWFGLFIAAVVLAGLTNAWGATPDNGAAGAQAAPQSAREAPVNQRPTSPKDKATATGVPSSKKAAPTLPAGATPAEVQQLIETLKDNKQRAKLISELELLLSTQQAAKTETASGMGGKVVATLSAHIHSVSSQVAAVASEIVQAPQLFEWIEQQASSPEVRMQWATTAGKAALPLIIGALAAWLLRLLTRRPRLALQRRTFRNVWSKLAYLPIWAAISLGPIAAFLAASYIVLPFVQPDVLTSLITLLLVNSIALACASVAVTQIVLMPAAPQLRLLRLSDEDAIYGVVWVRRISNVAIYGWALANGALLLGLPSTGYDALLKLVGLFVTSLLTILILQVRHSVARRLAGRSDDRQGLKVWRGLRTYLASVWHFIAIAYVVGIYAVWLLSIPHGFSYVVRSSLLTAVILIVAHYGGLGLRQGIARVFVVSADLRHRFPGLEGRANRYLVALQSVAGGLVYLAAALGILASWGIDTFAWIASSSGQVVVGRAVIIVCLSLGAVVVWEIVTALIARALTNGGAARSSQRARTLMPLARTGVGAVLFTLTGLTIVSELGVNIAPLLAGAGVIGVAVGFGSQTLVKDLVTGIFILAEDQIALGDVVSTDGHSGLVEGLTIRTLRLRSLDGNVHIIPYSQVTAVENFTKDYSRYVFNVGVAYREDVDEVCQVLKEIGAEMKADPEFGPKITGDFEVLGLDAFGDNAVVIKARVTTVPIEQWNVGREFNRRMKKRFDELGIEIPFPHRTIYFGVDKAGNAPPARVQVDGSAPSPAEVDETETSES